MAKMYPCDKCKVAFPKYPTLVLHYVNTHKGEEYPEMKEIETETLPEGYRLQEPKPKEKPQAIKNIRINQAKTPPPPHPLYKQMPEPSLILRKVLSEFPGITPPMTDEIMSWVELRGVLHPMEVAHLLTNLAGVPKGAIEIIPQKYALALDKAAQEGDANIRMTLASWGGLRQDFSGHEAFPGGAGMFQPFPRAPSVLPGFGFPGMGSPFYPYYQYDPNQPYPGYRPGTKDLTDEMKRELDPVVAQRLESMEQLIQTLTAKIIETEEEKKAAVLSARLERIENALLALQTPPGTTEESTKSSEHFTALQGELVKLREDIATNKISALEKEISGLRTQLTDTNQARIERLETELEETKELARKPATGRTEMDVVGSVIDKAVDKIADAGKDIKTIVLSGATREQFNPLRQKATEIAKQGDRLAATIEKAAELTEREAKFMGKS